MTTPQQLLQEADRCVKCGLCLPHCPTYRLNLDEGDSPRGRISLIQAWVGSGVASRALHQHLDRCLGCLACESACPSGVRYGELIDGARALDHRSESLWRGILLKMASGLPYRESTGKLLQLLQRSGLTRLARWGPGELRRLSNLLPALGSAAPLKPRYPATGSRRASVGLFTGCVARITERSAMDAAIRVLNLLGIDVVVPPGQRCCGAMHLHSGDTRTAEHLADINRQAFGTEPLDAVLYLASGCGAQLEDYGRFGGTLNAPCLEISRYLDTIDWPDTLEISPLDRRVLVHGPCSLRHTLKGEKSPGKLLARIPSIELTLMPDVGCCGAAGSYLVSQPAMADAVRRRTLDAVWDKNPEILVTSNTGCALHIAAGLREDGLLVEVMHPIELIDRQILKGRERAEGRGPRA
jgi:glycolate oxidase iron-sulfur subunit